MKVVIREYRPRDHAILVFLIEELQDYLVAVDRMHLRRRQPAYGASYARRLLQRVRTNCGKVYVAVVGKTMVGYAVCIVPPQTKTDLLEWRPMRTGRIEELYVCPGYRGKKIGKQLMSRMEKYLQDQHCDVVRVEVLSANSTADRFYRKLGFQERYADLIKFL